jgi:shikimate dehydrogenase
MAPDRIEISGRTSVYAHLAHPSAHVGAPGAFNRGFAERGIDAVTVSVDVAPADLAGVVAGFRGWRNLAGFGITMPHKKAMLTLVDRCEGQAEAIGAVNTVRRDPDGALVGRNVDGEGFVVGMRAAGHDLRGASVLLLGAGGAGRSIAFSLAEEGVADLTVHNRTTEWAETLVEDLRRVHPDLAVSVGPADPAGRTLVVNSTSIGMGGGAETPLDVELLAPETVVAEIVVSPPRTALLAGAERRGCATVGGMSMLANQIDLVAGFLGLRKETDGA